MGATAKQEIENLDLRANLGDLYKPSARTVAVVDVPELLFTMIDGAVDAGGGVSDSEEFLRSMEAMYAVAYGLKFMSKLREDDPIDFTVMPVEGLWASESGRMEFAGEARLFYTLLMVQPDHITDEMFHEAVSGASARHPNPAFERMRLERWREGASIQIMHVGPYATEPATIAVLEVFAGEHGHRLHGRHHEIYLGDPRRAKPEKLKTILRHPIAA